MSNELSSIDIDLNIIISITYSYLSRLLLIAQSSFMIIFKGISGFMVIFVKTTEFFTLFFY
jgi:hypothetical protein